MNKMGWLGISEDDEYYKWWFQEATLPIFITLIILSIISIGLSIYYGGFA